MVKTRSTVCRFLQGLDSTNSATLTQTDAAVLQQVAQVVKHGALVLSADAAEVTQETTAVGHHLGKSDLLEEGK